MSEIGCTFEARTRCCVHRN